MKVMLNIKLHVHSKDKRRFLDKHLKLPELTPIFQYILLSLLVPFYEVHPLIPSSQGPQGSIRSDSDSCCEVVRIILIPGVHFLII